MCCTIHPWADFTLNILSPHPNPNNFPPLLSELITTSLLCTYVGLQSVGLGIVWGEVCVGVCVCVWVRESESVCVCAGRLSKQYLWEVWLSAFLWKQTILKSHQFPTKSISISLHMCCGSALCLPSQPGSRWKEPSLFGKCLFFHKQRRIRGWTNLCAWNLPLGCSLAQVCSQSIGQRSPLAEPDTGAGGEHHLQEAFSGFLPMGRRWDPLQTQNTNKWEPSHCRSEQVLATVIDLQQVFKMC